MTRRRVSVVGALLLVVAIAACDGSGAAARQARAARTTTTSTRPAPTTTTTEPAPDPAPLAWAPCGGSIQCATLTVPVDYAHPRNATIGISLAREPAGDPAHRIGSLVVNPGGPGEAGTQLLGRDLGVLAPGVRARFDVIEMDPRGVGNSGGLHCSSGDTGSADGATADPIPVTAPARDALIAADRGYAQACARAAGPLLGYIGTTDVARDLEQLRKAVGDERLTFVGMSYGTLLGATYADLFPTHVRALVLDGVIDPSLPSFELWMAQAVGFQQQLDGFFAWCGSGCAWRPGIALPDALDRLTQRVRAQPLAVGNATAGVSQLYTALFSRLSSSSRWPSLAAALGAAEHGDGGPILQLTRSYLGQTPGATINADASSAINCLDHPVDTDLSHYDALAAQAAGRSRAFGPYLAWAGVMCATWSAPPTRQPHPVRAPGAPTALVIGTTSDAATPYAWAQSVAATFEHAVLLTRRATGHVAMLSSACVRDIVGHYLVDLAPPAPGTFCAG
ncbi:MAG TPA: alpha/beta hydrolase [Acidimicrobiia bacterium]